jgi:hypothetical protein
MRLACNRNPEPRALLKSFSRLFIRQTRAQSAMFLRTVPVITVLLFKTLQLSGQKGLKGQKGQ